MTMTDSLTIQGRKVSRLASPYVIAEVGVNHNGRVDLARQLIDVAVECGADAVKFQTFDPSRLVSVSASTAPYQAAATGEQTQQQMLASLALPPETWRELRNHAEMRGIHFLSTAFDVESARLLVELGVPALKVPSGELTNLPFVRELAAFGLPMLLSTGMGDLEEVRAAVEACEPAPSLALFHCVSAYPAPEREANLRAIATLQATFGVPTGWSDHTEGSLTAVAAVAAGATLLEKHITLDRAMEGPDHAASEDPGGFEEYVTAVRRTAAALGDGIKRPQPSELPNLEAARRSWHATRDLREGEAITATDVTALRPATGLPPSVSIVGRRLRHGVAASAAIHAENLEPAEEGS